MDIQDIQKDYAGDLKTIQIHVRTTKKVSKFMKDNSISPTKVFSKAILEVMHNETKTK